MFATRAHEGGQGAPEGRPQCRNGLAADLVHSHIHTFSTLPVRRLCHFVYYCIGVVTKSCRREQSGQQRRLGWFIHV